MGIKERQERDREAVRRAILDAARGLFVSEGYDNVSIRKVAERIEYSPAAIYGYFPSKDDIFFALAEEGFRLLGDPGVGEAHERLQNLPPLERVRAVFWRLYEFSRQQPEYFALMFVDRSVPRISREYERFAFAREMKRHIAEEIQRCIDAGQLAAAPLAAGACSGADGKPKDQSGAAAGVVGVAPAGAVEHPMARFIRAPGTLMAEERADVAAKPAGRVVAAPVERGTPVS